MARSLLIKMIVLGLWVGLLVVGVWAEATGFWWNDMNPERSNQHQADQALLATREDLLLPDIVVLPPRELFLDRKNNQRVIRFSTTFANVGEGALELVRQGQTSDGTLPVSQRIYAQDESVVEREVGEFVFHSDHDHWHTQDYVVFELWSVTQEGERDQLLATTDKLSFCIWDEDAYDLELTGASQTSIYLGCNNDTQGLSVGWSDTYASNIPGQELDVTEVPIPDGQYLVRTVVNPQRFILESEFANNESFLIIQIEGNTISRPEEME